MASVSTLRRSTNSSRAALLSTAPRSELEALSISRRLVKTVTRRLVNKRNSHGDSSSGCFGLYVSGGGCRVGACNELDGSEDCMPKIPGKTRAAEQSPAAVSLPDDVLEMILARLPLASLMAARCVCRRWRCMTTAPHFVQMRSEGPHQNPWLFLFGVARDGCRFGEIQALDVSVDQWHRISHGGLKGRSLFSVVSAGAEIYVIGGRSCIGDPGVPSDRSSFRTHKGVLVFSPLTGLWHKAAPMKSPRSAPVLGAFEVGANCRIFHRRLDRQERIQLKSRVGAVSDVYDDPHRFSLRRQLRDSFNESEDLHEKPSKSARQGRTNHSKFALIAVGGRGPWDEPLESGEVYDPVTNRWIEIARLPGDFGTVCSGAVCGRMFYVYSEADRLAGYNLERGFWVTIQTSRPPPCLRDYYPKLVSCRSRLFLMCVSWCERDGQLNRREKAVRKLWELDLALHTWNEVSRHPDAPMDWNAAFVADRDRIYGIEMFRIFGQVLDFLTACHVSDDGELKWTRISRKHAAHEANASSCTTKSMAVLRL